MQNMVFLECNLDFSSLNFETINIKIESRVMYVTLARAESRNALNAKLIQEISELMRKLKNNNDIRVVVIQGQGKVFCSGADLKWLRDIDQYSDEENLADSMALVECLDLIKNCNKPIIAFVHGAAVGGGVGIMLASDIIIAEEDTLFSVSEVGNGIVPAAIIDNVVDRIGITMAKQLLLTGERFYAPKALELGLINYCADNVSAKKILQRQINLLLNNAPIAIGIIKQMLNEKISRDSDSRNKQISQIIADLRKGEEAKSGINAFLNKKKPNWAE